MDTFSNIIYGFSVALQPTNLLFCFIGVFLGTLIGVLPGIGPVGALSILLPITYYLNPVTSIIMMAGIFIGTQYGGSTTSILVNIPGEASSVATCFDGYAMCRKGRAGPALGISAFGSFIAGTLSVFGLAVFSSALARFGLRFGPPEFFSLMILALTMVSYLARGSMIKALIMAAWGLLLSSVGKDLVTGKDRFVFGIPFFLDGINLIPILMGLFGISEVVSNMEVSIKREVFVKRIGGLFPDARDWKDSIGAIFRGGFVGFFLGAVPGVGTIIPTFLAYGIEKKISKTPERFGEGMIQGVAAPEAANNAAAQASFIPLFSLGIPSTAVMAILMSALMIHGLQPSPLMIQNNPDLFWGVVSSMYIGNVMLLILNLPLIPLWVQILRVPYSLLFPLILIFSTVGSYAIRNNVGDLIVMIAFGFIGYLIKKLKFEPAPLILAFILGPLIEVAFRQSLTISRGNLAIFLTRPMSLILLTITIILLGSSLLFKRKIDVIKDHEE